MRNIHPYAYRHGASSLIPSTLEGCTDMKLRWHEAPSCRPTLTLVSVTLVSLILVRMARTVEAPSRRPIRQCDSCECGTAETRTYMESPSIWTRDLQSLKKLPYECEGNRMRACRAPALELVTVLSLIPWKDEVKYEVMWVMVIPWRDAPT